MIKTINLDMQILIRQLQEKLMQHSILIAILIIVQSQKLLCTKEETFQLEQM
jgi:arsenate reductase-like glutaredoxin family protein